MAAGKEILTKIRSVESTQKITKAMQMVSNSKMRKTQDRMRAARPYADKVRDVIGHLAQTEPDIQLPLMRQVSEIKKAGFILITTDKGLCGGLNTNTLKAFFAKVSEYREQGIDVDVCALGLKGLSACQNAHIEVTASAVQLGDTPKFERLIGPLQILVKKFIDEEIDVVHVIYSRFENTMKQETVIDQLLPLAPAQIMTLSEDNNTDRFRREFSYEPDPLSVLDFLLGRYVESILYDALCENMASEQAARMVAMKSATENASNTIKSLRLVYNKSRQAAITTELTEICAGAAAVS